MAMVAIMFLKMSQNICKIKYYGSTVHRKPLEAIMSEKGTFVMKTGYAGEGDGSNGQCTTNETHTHTPLQRQFSQATSYNS